MKMKTNKRAILKLLGSVVMIAGMSAGPLSWSTAGAQSPAVLTDEDIWSASCRVLFQARVSLRH